MNETQQKEKFPDAPEIALRIFIFILIILAGIVVFAAFNLAKPERKRIKPEKTPPLVDIIRVNPAERQIIVDAMGTVTAAQEISLKARQSGEVIMVSPEFIPGGFFKKGDVILKTDPADTLIEVRRKEAALSSAKATLDIELGYQDVVKQELSLVETTTGKAFKKKELALRKPQLDQARAQYDAARADLDAAKLNHSRTIIRAPFNCMILTRSVNLGEHVSAQANLGTIAGTDAFWVEAAVPIDQLRWLRIPETSGGDGSRAYITSRYQEPEAAPHKGDVLKLTGSLTEQSRMGTLIVRVTDPLVRNTSDKRTPLILGSYVSLAIEGKAFSDLYAIPRKALRDNDTIWVMKEKRIDIRETISFGTGKEGNASSDLYAILQKVLRADDTIWVIEEKRLDIRSITPLWKGKNEIYLTEGIENGEAVIVSALSSPVNGMRVMEHGRNVEPGKRPSKKKKTQKRQ